MASQSMIVSCSMLSIAMTSISPHDSHGTFESIGRIPSSSASSSSFNAATRRSLEKSDRRRNKMLAVIGAELLPAREDGSMPLHMRRSRLLVPPQMTLAARRKVGDNVYPLLDPAGH